MGTKRPASAIHPSRSSQVPIDPSNKKRKVNPHPSRSLQPSNHAINPLKSRIRSLNRLLLRSDDAKKALPADIRLNYERELASLHSQIDDAERARRKKDLITKFHMVRFFDRRKAERKLKRAKRELGTATEKKDKEAVEGRIEEAQTAWNYAMYYPLDVAYSSLWPTGERKEKDGEEETVKGDREMWDLVIKCMEEGKLDALRNGRIYKVKDAEGGEQKKSAAKAAVVKAGKEGKKSKAKKEKEVRDDEQDSDGGFFE